MLPPSTARLDLRVFDPADAPAIHRVYADPDVMRYVGHGPVSGLEETEAMLGAYIDHQREHGFSFWAVAERETGELIGDAGLYRLDGGPEVELGFTLARSRWRRGYGTELARACLHAAFDELRLGEVLATVDPANTASLRLLERAGMRAAERRMLYGREHVVLRARP